MLRRHLQLLLLAAAAAAAPTATAAPLTGWLRLWQSGSSSGSSSTSTPPQHDAHDERHGEITRLPGFPGPLPSRHFGGYVSVGSRRLFYYLAESEGSPSSDPVVLWLNGGPGCSSFDGFVYEHGPFKFSQANHTGAVVLTENPFAWSKAASVIFLDSPSPVGLSYSTNHADYVTNDTATTADTHAFLRKFFRRYPHLGSQDFFIAGESYGGIYVPMLAREVVKGNARAAKPHINLKGYMVGNGCTDARFDGNARVPFAHGHSLISNALFTRAHQACGGEYHAAERGSKCASVLERVSEELAGLNLYNILDDCHVDPADVSNSSRRQRLASVLRTHRGWPVTGAVRQGQRVHNFATLLGHNPPCTLATEAERWLNDPSVREALHAAPQSLTGPWQLCSDRISYTADGGSMLPVHAYLLKAGLRTLIYSGDADLCVPHTGSEAWVYALHRSKAPECSDDGNGGDGDGVQHGRHRRCDGVSQPWAPWHNSASPPQVAGYSVEFDSGLTFATVKGAGHMVPQSKPLEALDMLRHFITGQPLAQRSVRHPGARKPQEVVAVA